MPKSGLTQKGKQRMIKAEISRLIDLFKGVDQNKLDFVQRQISQLAWFNINIQELQEKIDKSGTVIMYDNGGGQSGYKQNPDLKTLIEYQKLSNAIVRNLIPIIPPGMKKEMNELSKFRLYYRKEG